MKHYLLILTLVLFACTNLCAQQTNSEWSDDEIKQANTAAGTSLSEEEQLVILYCNLARLNGAKFLETYADDYLSGTSKYEASLRKELKTISNLPMLQPEANLCKSAKYHAEDMGKNGRTGHSSTNGQGFADRLYSYYDGGAIAENCSYGHKHALDIVMQLLIDQGVESLGHRRNILNRSYTAIGVCITTHTQYKYNCVQDFGDKVITKME